LLRESRESKVNLLEEELRLKITEVAKQLANKEEELNFIKKRFKEEKTNLEKEKSVLQKVIMEKEKENNSLETAFRNFRREVDESPLSIMRAEINKKNMEIEELNKEKERSNKEKEKLEKQIEKLKLDLIKMKKTFEQEKEAMFKQKIDEVEKLKFEIHNQRMSQVELQELAELRNRVKSMNNNQSNININNNVGLNENKKDEEKKNNNYRIINVKRDNTSKERKDNFSSDLEKLINEKNNLLRSGMYNEKDGLIQKLDFQIRKFIEQN